MCKCSCLAAEVLQLNHQVSFILLLVNRGILLLLDSLMVMLLGVCFLDSFAKEALYIIGGSMGATTCCLVFAANCCLSVLAARSFLGVLAAFLGRAVLLAGQLT